MYIIVIMLIVVGGYQMFRYAGKDWAVFGFALGMHLLGWLILILYAVHLIHKKKKNNRNNDDDNNDNNYY